MLSKWNQILTQVEVIQTNLINIYGEWLGCFKFVHVKKQIKGAFTPIVKTMLTRC